MNDLLRNHSFCLGATDLREVKFENICSWRCFHTSDLTLTFVSVYYIFKAFLIISRSSVNFFLTLYFLVRSFFVFFFFQLQNVVKIFVVHLKPYPQLSGLTCDLSLALTVHAQRLSHLSKMVAKTVS